jgi:hypothetical protein
MLSQVPALVGVPLMLPDWYEKASHEGRFLIKKRSVSPSASCAEGVNEYFEPIVATAAGEPEIVGAVLAAAKAGKANDAPTRDADASRAFETMRVNIVVTPKKQIPLESSGHRDRTGRIALAGAVSSREGLQCREAPLRRRDAHFTPASSCR